jgi:hypothetical protein
MIVGGNKSILLWIGKENLYVNLRRKIITLKEGNVKIWIADMGTKLTEYKKGYLKDIFISCLSNCIFLNGKTETMLVCSDLSKAINTFKELTQKDWITNTI